MTLNEKQIMYKRFQSKVESACYPCVESIIKDNNLSVSSDFINKNVIPEMWGFLNKIVPELASNTSKK